MKDRTEYFRKYNKNYYMINKEKERERKRHYWKKYAYNISPEEYQLMVKEQKGLCAICQKASKVLQIDHDHLTGHIRGLLCKECNVGLGYIEKKEFLESAQRYLTVSGLKFVGVVNRIRRHIL